MTTRIATPRRSTIRNEGRILLVAIVATVFAIALGVGAAGQQRPGQDVRPTQTSTVDFMAITNDGQPVTDLKAEEVTLKVDGKIRPIRSLQFIRLSSPSGGPAPSAVAPAFATNMTTAADLPRSIVLVVDDETMPIGQEQKVRTALSNFVRDLPPTDQVALITVPHGGIKVPLTSDRERLRKEIANISPISPIEAAGCRTRTTLSTLQSTLELLTRTSEQPVIVALLSASMTGTSTAEAAQRPGGTAAGGVSSQAGACYLQNDDFVQVGQAVAAARAALYIIHPDYTQTPASEGIGNLQGQTNAPLFHLTSNTEPGLTRMARETSGYYLATFETEQDELVGKPHPSSVKTTRKDVVVRDHPYVIVGRAAPSAHAIVSSTTVTSAVDLVRSGKQYRDLTLRATASSFRNANGTVNVIALFEPTDPSVKVMMAAAALIDETGIAREMWQGDAEMMKGWPTALGLSVKPGTYRLRIGAIDSNGRMGLVDDQLVAELRQAGPLQISGLLLGVRPGGKFTPRVEFSTEPEAIAYLELYGATEGARVGAVIEVANSTDGRASMTLRGDFEATGEDGKYAVTAKIPLASLAPGDYVVRAIVQAEGQPAARVIRTLHKGR